MFYSLEDDVIAAIENSDMWAVDFFDNCMVAHRMANIIVVLTRKDLLRIAKSDAISNLSRGMLSFISNRANDYAAAMATASRIIRVCTDTITNNIIINGRDAFINVRHLTIRHLLTQKFVLGEGFRDVKIIEMLSTIYLRTIGYPDSYVSFRSMAGGGGALCQVLDAETISPVKGIVLCDADTHQLVPPFPLNTTGYKAWNKAVSLCLLDTKLGISNISPFFAFVTTEGQTIENMIRPHTVEAFFNANNQFRDRRASFVDAFPKFPELDDLELLMWRNLNLKKKTPSIAHQLSAIRQKNGTVPISMAARTAEYAALSFPSDLLDWIIEHWTASHHSRSIQRAVVKDLLHVEYERAVSEWAIALAHIASGDQTATRT